MDKRFLIVYTLIFVGVVLALLPVMVPGSWGAPYLWFTLAIIGIIISFSSAIALAILSLKKIRSSKKPTIVAVGSGALVLENVKSLKKKRLQITK